mmetsp:Transcript_10903/g.19434  ORF Transcript_10903/g.19434 Transcript_10903/m.19434 type:complete len:609 (+) Transcript_10903:33-1859(+)
MAADSAALSLQPLYHWLSARQQADSSGSASPFYSSGGEETVTFQVSHSLVAVETIEHIWPNMLVELDEGTGAASAKSVSDYTKELLTGESPFGGDKGSVKIPKGGADTDQLAWGEYVVYSRKQVCYIAANIVAGNAIPEYHSGLSRLIPPESCDKDLYKAGFKRALIGLLAACSVDPTLADGAQGPMLIVAKSTNDPSMAPKLSSDEAKATTLRHAGLRTCRFRDGSSNNERLGSIPQSPSSSCDPAANIDFMRDGNNLHGQAIVDITAAWIGGYVLAQGGCGGFDGGQDERLMTFMPEVMTLSFFLSARPSPQSSAGVSLLVPAYVLGARKIFSGFDGTSRDAGPDFNAGKPKVYSAVPLKSDLLTITVNGHERLISQASPFLGFQSINQESGLANKVPTARLNQNPIQIDMDGEFGFPKQVAAWYNAVSLTSWHPDMHAILKKTVVAIGTGPWGSGVWWGNSQIFFLAMWMGQALSASSWGETLPLDYNIYSSFTENPSNQCLVHAKDACRACLRACDNDGAAGPPFTELRYCCMEPAAWIPSPGLFDGKPCIPEANYTACGTRGLAEVYDRYVDKSVAELWNDLEAYIAYMFPVTKTVFDTLFGA